jgi:hypothetical protein
VDFLTARAYISYCTTLHTDLSPTSLNTFLESKKEKGLTCQCAWAPRHEDVGESGGNGSGILNVFTGDLLSSCSGCFTFKEGVAGANVIGWAFEKGVSLMTKKGLYVVLSSERNFMYLKYSWRYFKRVSLRKSSPVCPTGCLYGDYGSHRMLKTKWSDFLMLM